MAVSTDGCHHCRVMEVSLLISCLRVCGGDTNREGGGGEGTLPGSGAGLGQGPVGALRRGLGPVSSGQHARSCFGSYTCPGVRTSFSSQFLTAAICSFQSITAGLDMPKYLIMPLIMPKNSHQLLDIFDF